MKRSGGKAGRPFGHMSIEAIETHVNQSRDDLQELMSISAELGNRKTRRALELADLVARLIRNSQGEQAE